MSEETMQRRIDENNAESILVSLKTDAKILDVEHGIKMIVNVLENARREGYTQGRKDGLKEAAKVVDETESIEFRDIPPRIKVDVITHLSLIEDGIRKLAEDGSDE